MAVLSVLELPEGRASSMTMDGRGQVVRTYIRVFQVFTDDMTTAQIEVRDAAGIPALWSLYQTLNQAGNAVGEADLGARVVELNPQQDVNNPFRWTVEVKYSSKWRDEANNIENPLLRPADISWENIDFQEAVQVDEQREDPWPNGRPYMNVVREPFDPPIQRDATRLTCVAIKNFAFYDAALWSTYLNPNSLNDAIFMGFEPAQAKCKQITGGKVQVENDVVFVPVTFRIEFRNGTYVDPGGPLDGVTITWDEYYANVGFSKVDPETAAIVPILDASGQVVTKPQFLDAAGELLNVAVDPVVYVGPFRKYPRKDFSLFGI